MSNQFTEIMMAYGRVILGLAAFGGACVIVYFALSCLKPTNQG